MKFEWILAYTALFLLLMGVAYSATTGGATVSTSTVGGAGAPTPGSFTVNAGNIYNITASSWSSTEKWAGVYGNVSGFLLLGTSGSQYLFKWSESANNVVAIYFSGVDNANLTSLSAATQTDVTNELGSEYGEGSDAWSNTFTGSGGDSDSALIPDTGVPYATTEPSGSAFYTYSLKDGSGKLVWAGNIHPSGAQTFNGQYAHFQVILPAGTFYVWLEIK